jgi:hypothetical protein
LNISSLRVVAAVAALTLRTAVALVAVPVGLGQEPGLA